MKSSSAILACSTLLAGGAASAASSEWAATAAAVSMSVSQNSSRRTERLRNQHNVYKSTLGSTNRASRRLGIFFPVPSPTPSTINNSTTTTNTTTTTSSPTAAATRPSGIFGVGGTPSTSTSSSSPSSSPSESPSDSTTVSDTPAPYYFPFGNDTPYTFGFDLCLSMMSMSVAPSTSPSASESPSNVSSSTSTTATPTFKLTTIAPSVTASPTKFSLSVDYNDNPFDFDDGSPMSIPETFSPVPMGTMAPAEVPVPPTMAPSGVSPSPTTATLPVVEKQCEFCNEVSMNGTIIIPFSNETTCGMAKDVVIQLNSTSEDCELARKAEAICCPKPATLAPVRTAVPTISWQPTEAPVPRPESNKSSSSVITTTLTMGVVISSCLVASWIGIGLP